MLSPGISSSLSPPALLLQVHPWTTDASSCCASLLLLLRRRRRRRRRHHHLCFHRQLDRSC
ncbi:hypothetical protein BDA96_02G123900 [Sorghum bicolor]|uniref:Uncharacterized protein n=1 Tax=Sorghum bicolor TaxID=4558 RepID=A0A921RMY4_SORBI|nr:hypothetical protein BDA96_02G123900 [Sorghum bicolor]